MTFITFKSIQSEFKSVQMTFPFSKNHADRLCFPLSNRRQSRKASRKVMQKLQQILEDKELHYVSEVRA